MSDGKVASTYGALRELAYEDPLETKEALLKLFAEEPKIGLEVLGFSTDERGSRFRQIAARSIGPVHGSPELKLLLRTWIEFEKDEFALAAIADALSIDAPGKRKKRLRTGTGDLAELEGTYRYVSSRLRHRVLNALPATGMTVSKLRRSILRIVASQEAAELSIILDQLYGQLTRLERAVEFDDDRRYFQLRSVNLQDWTQGHQTKFVREFGRVAFSFAYVGDQPAADIDAIPYCLETIFTNLWKNSLDELSGKECAIDMRAERKGKELLVTLVDNGSGFRQTDVERAFQFQFSSKSKERGRGHMEVRDAMERMAGAARVISTAQGYRVQLAFRVTMR